MAFLKNSTQKMPLLSKDLEKGADLQEQDDNCETQEQRARTGFTRTRSAITLGILFYVNLVTFMTSFTVAGAEPYLKDAFKIGDSKIGWINTVFVVSCMLCGPVYGFLGDRWNRIYIACAGMALASAASLATSFVPNEYFTVFLLINGLVGAGKEGFTTIAPSIIADIFVGDKRSRALYIYNFAVFIGCGLGYIIGSKVTGAIGDWHWTFRIAPSLGIIGVLLMAAFIKDPSRGAAQGKNIEPSSGKKWISDGIRLFKNPSFMFSTFGSMAVKFTAGAIGVFAPDLLTRARTLIEHASPCQTGVCNYNDSMIFGLLLVLGGIIGVAMGVEISKRYHKYNSRADPIVCGVGLLIGAPFLSLAIWLADISLVATYIFIFIAQVFITLNWSISDDIRLYVVTPARRSTAEAMTNFICNVGEAVSALCIGKISDSIKSSHPDSALSGVRSLQHALTVCPFVVLLGGICFLACTCFIENDRKEAETESEDCVLEEVVVKSP